MDRKNSRIFIGCRSGVTAIVDTVKGNLLTTIPIGSGVDATTYDVERKLVFNSNGDGTLTIIKQLTPDKYETVQTLKTQSGARTMAIDQKTHKLFLATAEYEPGPEPAPGQPRRRGKMIPGSFRVLVVGN
jgi:hypothetical protein